METGGYNELSFYQYIHIIGDDTYFLSLPQNKKIEV
jgi:hypothetical protein